MTTTARELMQSSTLTVPASMTFREIQHLLVVAGIHGAPVVDDSGGVIGIVSALDLLRAADQAHDEDLDEGEAPDDEDDAGAIIERMTATDLATPDVIWVPAEMPAREVARVMTRDGVHRVLVGSDGKLEGIITTFDLLQLIETGAAT